MKRAGEILREERLAQKIPIEKVASQLLIKKEHLQALEEGDWAQLPEPAYIKGFVKSYASLLGIDAVRLLALIRGEYDEKKFQAKSSANRLNQKRLMFTPEKLAPAVFLVGLVIFITYLALQYTSIAKSPELEITTPSDDLTTTASVIEVAGQTEEGATVSVDGQLVPVDPGGKFFYQLKLEEGKNVIEIIASKKLSPKSKVTRIVRLSR